MFSLDELRELEPGTVVYVMPEEEEIREEMKTKQRLDTSCILVKSRCSESRLNNHVGTYAVRLFDTITRPYTSPLWYPVRDGYHFYYTQQEANKAAVISISIKIQCVENLRELIDYLS